VALTKFDICSRALIGLDRESISSFSDDSKEAEVASLLYEGVYHSELSSYQWNFATTTIEISREVATPTDTNWTYQFALPSDWLRTINVTDPNGNDIDYTERGGKVLANGERAFLLYQAIIVESSLPAYFVDSLQARLKAEFAEPLSGEGNVIDRAWGEYDRKVKAARKIDAQANPPVQLVSTRNSTWVRARNGW